MSDIVLCRSAQAPRSSGPRFTEPPKPFHWQLQRKWLTTINYSIMLLFNRCFYHLHLRSSFSNHYQGTSAPVDLDRPTWLMPFKQSPGFLVVNDCGRRWLRHWMFHLHDCPLSATELSPSPSHEYRTFCQLKWRHQIPYIGLQTFKTKKISFDCKF